MNRFQVFLSNQVECLYSHLKKELFLNTSVFTKRMIIVPSPAMKSWLLMQMANDQDLNIAAGIEVVYLEPAIDKIIQILSEHPETFPKKLSPLELSLSLEINIREIIDQYHFFSEEEKNVWQPLITYLLSESEHKEERLTNRLTALSHILSHLYLMYGKYGEKLIQNWQAQEKLGWQERLWKNLVNQTSPESFSWKVDDVSIHIFSVSFLTEQQIKLFYSLGQKNKVNYYLLSPCQVFWSDVLSDKEGKKLEKIWKRGASSSHLEFDEYIFDRNQLLANLGRVGRQMAKIIELSGVKTIEDYVLPSAALSYAGYQDLVNESHTHFKKDSTFTLLLAVQADINVLKNVRSQEKINFFKDNSIQINVASSKLKEVQILYDALCRLIEKEKIKQEDIIVMAPDIMEYHPFIRAVFEAEESFLDCQIMDVHTLSQNTLIQGFLHLISLGRSRFCVKSVMKLFNFPAFQKKHGLTKTDVNSLRTWIKACDIRWGINSDHRDEIVKKSQKEAAIVDNDNAGTWEFGWDRLLLGLVMSVNVEDDVNFQLPIYPLTLLEMSETEKFGKWIELLTSLKEDLKPLIDGTSLSLKEWSSYLKCLLESYFSQVPAQEIKEEDVQSIYRLIEAFEKVKDIKESTFSFNTVFFHLEQLMNQERLCYRESHVSAIKFCSLMPMRAVPKKVIALLGMSEGAFPRRDRPNSLNLLSGSLAKDFYPSTTDQDRYLFLETLLSVRKHFLLSYTGYSQTDGKEVPPSLIISELLSYLDRGYTLDGHKVSKSIITNYPFNPYDKKYFEKDSSIKSFSQTFFQAAEAYYKQQKRPEKSFMSDFSLKVTDEEIGGVSLDLKDLNAMARNPFEAYFKKTLGMYLERTEDRVIKADEDFLLNALDQAILKKSALKKDIKDLLQLASKQGKFPIGPFKPFATQKLTQEVEELALNLRKLNISKEEIFQIEMTEKVEKPTRLTCGRWLLPPLKQRVKGKEITLTGILPDVTSLGLLTLNKFDKTSAIKAWPAYLVFCVCVDQFELQLSKKILFFEKREESRLFFRRLKKRAYTIS